VFLLGHLHEMEKNARGVWKIITDQ
jgi:hypothetical protein